MPIGRLSKPDGAAQACASINAFFAVLIQGLHLRIHEIGMKPQEKKRESAQRTGS
jgi:hypothetical protein